MKKILIFVLALFAYQMTNAQGLSIGLRAGVSSSALQVSESFDVTGGSVQYNDGDKVLGWHAGLFARISISSLYIQPELLFTQTGGNIVVSGTGYSTEEVGKITFSNLSIPVLVGVKLGKIFRINAGPAFNIVLSQKVDDNIKNMEQTYKSATVGYQAGIGVDISKLLIDLKYEGSLSKLGDTVTDPVSGTTFDTDMRSSQIILSVGIKLN